MITRRKFTNSASNINYQLMRHNQRQSFCNQNLIKQNRLQTSPSKTIRGPIKINRSLTQNDTHKQSFQISMPKICNEIVDAIRNKKKTKSFTNAVRETLLIICTRNSMKNY